MSFIDFKHLPEGKLTKAGKPFNCAECGSTGLIVHALTANKRSVYFCIPHAIEKGFQPEGKHSSEKAPPNGRASHPANTVEREHRSESRISNAQGITSAQADEIIGLLKDLCYTFNVTPGIHKREPAFSSPSQPQKKAAPIQPEPQLDFSVDDEIPF